MLDRMRQPTLTLAFVLGVGCLADRDDYEAARAHLMDIDGDGDLNVIYGGGDCDDHDPEVSSEQPELCGGSDEDCDGTIDEAGAVDAPTWFGDGDADGHGDPEISVVACDPPLGFVDVDDDCDDGNAALHPDTIWYVDSDGDGFGDLDYAVQECFPGPGYSLSPGDCDDGDAQSWPGADEVCGVGTRTVINRWTRPARWMPSSGTGTRMRMGMARRTRPRSPVWVRRGGSRWGATATGRALR